LVNAPKSNRTPVNTAVDVLSDDAFAIANIADVDFPSVAIGAVAVTISGRTLASALHVVAGAARCAICSADAGVNEYIADVEAAVCTTASTAKTTGCIASGLLSIFVRKISADGIQMVMFA